MAKVTFEQADTEFQKAIQHLKDEFLKLRSGRANPDLVANINVEAYSQMMPLNQLANINVADPTLLVVQPWDKSLMDAVVKAIKLSGIGINPMVDHEIIRLPLPPLTQERREEYVKILGQKEEEARVQIRQVRKEILLDTEEKAKKDGISEDDTKRKEEELQKKVDQYNKQVEELAKAKETELMTV
jgi:ribosome recycling factor